MKRIIVWQSLFSLFYLPFFLFLKLLCISLKSFPQYCKFFSPLVYHKSDFQFLNSSSICCLKCRYKKLLSSVDLTKDFFFSYTYPIMQSLQKNVTSMGEDGMPYDNMFVWNAYLTRAIRSRCGNTIWTIALVHGNFKQVCNPFCFLYL